MQLLKIVLCCKRRENAWSLKMLHLLGLLYDALMTKLQITGRILIGNDHSKICSSVIFTTTDPIKKILGNLMFCWPWIVIYMYN